MMHDVVLRTLAALALVLPCSAAVAFAQGDASSMVRLLKSGRLPPDRVANVVNLVCQRGNQEDLAFVFQESVKPEGYKADLRRQVLEGLATAAQTRKVIPAVPVDALLPLLDDADPATARAAVQLAAAWKAQALAPPLAERVLATTTTDAGRRLALDALLAIGGDVARQTTEKLLNADNPRLRAYGVAALAGSNIDDAAKRAATELADPAQAANIDVMLAVFLDRREGSDKLAAALGATQLPADSAKLALRHLYLAGRSDPALVEVLGKSAGIGAERDPPTLEELKTLAAEALAKGDPARGEAIFRRADLGCLKCHAVSGGGGDVGPDLSPVGATSPIDYVIMSILHPDQSIKESFLTRSFTTADGLLYQGIVVDRDDTRVVIKDATGKRITIPTADIDEEAEGRSLMPKGLATFLTQPEFFDLVRFVGELGKAGPYAVRSQPSVQRWRYLKDPPTNFDTQPADAPDIVAELQGAEPDRWAPAYARVSGVLPLEELTADGKRVLYLAAEVDVTQAGEVEIKLDAAAGVTMWVDNHLMPVAGPAVTSLDRGLHKIFLRVDAAARKSNELRVVIDKPAGSTAVYTVVGGP